MLETLVNTGQNGIFTVSGNRIFPKKNLAKKRCFS